MNTKNRRVPFHLKGEINMTQEKSATAMLVETPIEEFLDYVKTISLGELKSVSNYLKIEYERVNSARQGLLIASENAPKKDLKAIDETVQRLMVILQLIEDRVLILAELEKERSL